MHEAPVTDPTADPAVAAADAGGIVPDVSIVLPVYNEKGHLRQEIDRIRAAMDASEFSYEMIVIDDGSNDGSGEALREIEGIRLIQFLTNRGSGSARKFGTRAARGRIVVWTDVDMSYPNDLIPELVREMEGYDQVVGARTSEEGTHKLFRVPAKLFIRKLASYRCRPRSPTSTRACGPSAATSPSSTSASCRPGSAASPRSP
jgi:glycosyltransferase involved in cell wall biosynthesis